MYMNNNNYGTIIGRLVADPVVRVSEAGNKVAFIRVAISRNYKNKEGNYDADFIGLSAFGKTAEFIEKHFQKGSPINVQTTLRSRTVEVDGENGEKVNRTQTDVIAEQVSFLPGSSNKSETAPTANEGTSESAPTPEVIDDDDLPF